jgi:hypothetical protein
MAHEAFSSIADLDADDAIRWLTMIEPAVASRIEVAGAKTLTRVSEHHGPKLTDAQNAVIRRAVCNTAVATATALLEGRHNLWADLINGPLANTLYPWVGVKRQVVLHEITLPPSANAKRGRHKKVKKQDGVEIMAEKLGITSCVPAEDHSMSPTKTVVLLTSAGTDRMPRHQMLNQQDGEALLRALTHSLAGMGSKSAIAAWPAVCGGDASLDPPWSPKQTPDQRDED